MTRVTWILLGAAISAGVGVTVIPLAERSTEYAQAQPAPAPPQPQPAPEVKTAPETPIAEKKAELGDDHTWDPAWDKDIEQSLPADMLSPKVAKAVRPFCPRFNQLTEVDKRAFWAYFFQALAGAEAGLEPTANVRHTEPELAVKDDVTHRMVRQEGLLQLTYMDQERYGCDFDWEKDKALAEHDPNKTILQPKNNLLCGVNIIRNQLVDQHKPLLTSTSYFSTLQPGTVSVKVFLKQMANVPATCGRGTHVNKERTAPVREAAAVPAPTQPASAPSAQSASAVVPAQPR